MIQFVLHERQRVSHFALRIEQAGGQPIESFERKLAGIFAPCCDGTVDGHFLDYEAAKQYAEPYPDLAIVSDATAVLRALATRLLTS